jgi:hypothetical protein
MDRLGDLVDHLWPLEEFLPKVEKVPHILAEIWEGIGIHLVRCLPVLVDLGEL